MAEQLDLTAPITTPNRTTYVIRRIVLSWTDAFIEILLQGSDGALITATYEGATATTLLIAFNKVNLATKSLQRRVLEQLVTDGKIPGGTVSGTPA